MKISQTNKPFRRGVNAIILDKNNNFLLIQKNGYEENEWNFLGGGREGEETLEQNLFRELKEEIAADSSDFKIIGISSHKIEYDHPAELAIKINGGIYRGQSYEQVVLRFIGDKDKLVFTSDEFRAHKWVKPSELIDHLVFLNQYQNHKKAIDEILPGVI